ncbi:MAG: 4Fe-4S ferredoxin, partial [Thermoplasmata archaeon]
MGYLLGVILLRGGLFGRGSCGWACPVGLLQDGLKHPSSTPLQRTQPKPLAVLS